MLIERTFYISVSKKYTQTEVFGFEVKTELPKEADPDCYFVRTAVARKFCLDSKIPLGWRGPCYWVSAVCIDF